MQTLLTDKLWGCKPYIHLEASVSFGLFDKYVSCTITFQAYNNIRNNIIGLRVEKIIC